MVYYFAYGSNLNTAQLITRIGKWKSAKKAKLAGYSLVFDCDSHIWKGKTANIRKTNKEEVVYGVVYEISQEQLNILSKEYEKIQPSIVKTIAENSKELAAETYIFKEGDRGMPPKKYLDIMIEGLRQHGYNGGIIDKVKKIAEQGERKG